MNKILGLIGLAKRAGRISEGAEFSEDAVRRGRSKLVIVAADTSENGKKAIRDCCEHYKVKYVLYATKTELGKAVGSELRSVISVNDDGFAAAILKKLAE